MLGLPTCGGYATFKQQPKFWRGIISSINGLIAEKFKVEPTNEVRQLILNYICFGLYSLGYNMLVTDWN